MTQILTPSRQSKVKPHASRYSSYHSLDYLRNDIFLSGGDFFEARGMVKIGPTILESGENSRKTLFYHDLNASASVRLTEDINLVSTYVQISADTLFRRNQAKSNLLRMLSLNQNDVTDISEEEFLQHGDILG